MTQWYDTNKSFDTSTGTMEPRSEPNRKDLRGIYLPSNEGEVWTDHSLLQVDALNTWIMRDEFSVLRYSDPGVIYEYDHELR